MILHLSDSKIYSHYTTLEIFQALLKTSNLLNTPIAIWKLPNEAQWHCIVSDKILEIERIEIEQCGGGFIVNKFKDKGLDKVSFIRSDLYFSSNSNEIRNLRTDINSAFYDRFNKIFITQLKSKVETPTSEIGLIEFEDEGENEFKENVKLAVDEINKGSFQKVVLSRKKIVTRPLEFNLLEIFEKLSLLYPNTFTSVISIPEIGAWIGASPEILISLKNNIFKTSALAGTQSAAGKENLREVLWSQKEIEEQVFVNRYIINCFKKIRLREYSEEGPKTVRAGNLLHLRTDLIVDLSEVNFPQLASVMIDLLHPTSAVCGMPHQSAYDFITKKEKFDRELFTGYLGPVNINESTNIFVNLRCMKVEGYKATMFAGAGVTEDSKPEKEWLETEMKFKTLLNVIL